MGDCLKFQSVSPLLSCGEHGAVQAGRAREQQLRVIPWSLGNRQREGGWAWDDPQWHTSANKATSTPRRPHLLILLIISLSSTPWYLSIQIYKPRRGVLIQTATLSITKGVGRWSMDSMNGSQMHFCWMKDSRHKEGLPCRSGSFTQTSKKGKHSAIQYYLHYPLFFSTRFFPGEENVLFFLCLTQVVYSASALPGARDEERVYCKECGEREHLGMVEMFHVFVFCGVGGAGGWSQVLVSTNTPPWRPLPASLCVSTTVLVTYGEMVKCIHSPWILYKWLICQQKGWVYPPIKNLVLENVCFLNIVSFGLERQ